MVVTEGSEALRALKIKVGELALALGVSERTLMRWLTGEKTPESGARKRIRAVYGIAPSAWDRVPAPPPPPLPAKPPSAFASIFASLSEPVPPPPPPTKRLPSRSGRPSTLAETDHMIDVLRARFDEFSDPRVASELNKALALKVRQEREESLSEDRYVRNHRKWKECRDRLLAALIPFPEAMEAVVNALEDIDMNPDEDEES